jgi:hypothetical protein
LAWRTSLAKHAQKSIWKELVAIGYKRMQEGPSPVAGTAEANSWLSQWSCNNSTEDYTHSSLFGCRDRRTESGRLNIPEEPEVRMRFHQHAIELYDRGSPLCLVEMCTSHYPFIEDIDVMGSSEQGSRPPDDMLLHSKEFWNLRVKALTFKIAQLLPAFLP